MFKVKLKKSLIGCSPAQRKTLTAMGLKYISQERILQESSVFEGMINSVKHLIEVTKL